MRPILKIIDQSTGEAHKVDPNASLRSLSEARRIVATDLKELENQLGTIDELIRPHLDVAVDNEEETLSNYWKIQRGARRFSKSKFKAEAPKKLQDKYKHIKELLSEIEEDYKEHGKPFLKFPKL